MHFPLWFHIWCDSTLIKNCKLKQLFANWHQQPATPKQFEAKKKQLNHHITRSEDSV